MGTSIENIKVKALPILKSAGARKAGIFGSFARGEDNAKSDVDILIEPPDGMTLFDLAGLTQELESVLDRRVDVLTYGAVHPRLKPYITKDLITIL